MKVYELIYYYDDIAYGTELCDSTLTTDAKSIKEKIKDFIDQNIKADNKLCAEESINNKYNSKIISFIDNEGNTSNLEIREHTIK